MTHRRRNAAAMAALVLLLVGCSEPGARAAPSLRPAA
jgi:hypothetical protein